MPDSQNQKDKFKIMFINNQQIMDKLFELLASKNNKIVNDIWELLSFLPFNKSLEGRLEKLDIETEEEWFSILDVACTRKLLYCLKIVSDLAVSQRYIYSRLFGLNICLVLQVQMIDGT